MSEFTVIRDRARELGLDVFQKSTSVLQAEVAEAEAILDQVSKTGEENGLAGRPKKAGDTWKWRNRFEVVGRRDDAFRYRFVSTETGNLRDKLADGWVYVDATSGIPGEHTDPSEVADGKALSGAQTYRDMVLMALPEERAKLRDEAVREMTEKQTAGIMDRLRGGMQNPDGQSSPVTGKITIIE